MNERLKLLGAMPVFGGLSADALVLLTELARPITVAAGEHFFHEGDESQVMYVLESGRVEIYKTWQSVSTVLRVMKAGDCFGEMALIDLFPRSASAVALETSKALQITPEILHELYSQDPEQYTLLQMNIGRELSRRLRRIDDLLFRALMGDALPDSTISEVSLQQ